MNDETKAGLYLRHKLHAEIGARELEKMDWKDKDCEVMRDGIRFHDERSKKYADELDIGDWW